jgi:excinuclease UvrABC nuclease subunit
VAVIEAVVATLPLSPGVYRMLDGNGDALYVGKARSLKKRVASYTQANRLDERLRRMVMDTVSMEIVTTHTEAEALLLEANLIKRLRPRYNIVLRDDKSYPWLMLAEDHEFPQIAKHRGAVRQRVVGQPDGDGDGTGFPAPLLRRYRVRYAQPALPAAPDQAVLGAVRGPHRSR